MRATRILTVAGVVAAGVCAAWPFRQPAPRLVDPPASAVPLELTLHRADAALAAPADNTVSPAVGLETARASFSPTSLHAPLAAERLVDLENLVPPPEMPLRFEPRRDLADVRPSADDARASLAPRTPLESAPRPRTYRLRDGDTLEILSQRFLGSPDRAAEIFEANRDVLLRPDLLPVGRTLTIPPR